MPSSVSEPVNWNEVKVMLEAQDKNITVIAEGFADIRPRIVRMEKSIESLVEVTNLMLPAIQGATKDIREIKLEVQDNTKAIGRIETRLDTLDERLKTVETK